MTGMMVTITLQEVDHQGQKAHNPLKNTRVLKHVLATNKHFTCMSYNTKSFSKSAAAEINMDLKSVELINEDSDLTCC